MPDQATVSRKWRILTFLLMAVVLVTSGFAALSSIPGIWIFDQLSQFRLVYPLILAVCLPILCALRAFRALVLSLILLIVTTIPVATMFFPTRGAVADGSARPKEIPLSVLNFNSEFQHNDNYKSFAELVKTREPDVVAMLLSRTQRHRKHFGDLKSETGKYVF